MEVGLMKEMPGLNTLLNYKLNWWQLSLSTCTYSSTGWRVSGVNVLGVKCLGGNIYG